MFFKCRFKFKIIKTSNTSYLSLDIFCLIILINLLSKHNDYFFPSLIKSRFIVKSLVFLILNLKGKISLFSYPRTFIL